MSAGSPQEWVYFVGFYSNINPSIKVMKAINLDSGKISEILALNGNELIAHWVGATNFPSEGSNSFLMSGVNNKSEMLAWAINSDEGLRISLKGEYGAGFSLGGISQDGKWGVYSITGIKVDKSVVIINMKTGRTRTIAPGTSSVWLVD